MIVPMVKYSFLIHCDDYAQFMSSLKALGVLHIIEKTKEPTTDIIAKYKLLADVKKTITLLEKIRDRQNVNSDGGATESGEVIYELCCQLLAQREQVDRQLVAAERERKSLLPWGYFSKPVVDGIIEIGWKPRFFICSAHKYQPQWETAFDLFPISRMGNNAYFVVFDNGCFVAPDWEADEVVLPDATLANVDTRISELVQIQKDIANHLKSIAANNIVSIQGYALELKDDVLSQSAVMNTQSEVEGHVMVLEGWVPETSTNELAIFLDQNNSLYLADTSAAVREKPPVVLKNNRFNRLFEVIGNIYSLPNYNELDLTRFVAPFYLLFFGFCFSDAGYGLLVVVAAAIAKYRTKMAKPILSLAQLLGASTIVFGMLGGTFFGINLYEANLPIYSSLSAMLSQSNIKLQDIVFNAALVLGAIQILLGMFVKVAKIKKQSGFKYAISSLCWVLLIIASGFNYWLTAKHIVDFWNAFYLGFGLICLVGIFFYNMPDKGVLYNIGGGVWDAYNTIIGGVGDLLSYVRLFALSLASGILGMVFNQLATSIVDADSGIVARIFGYFFMLLVLVVGHSINIFMSGLGSVVHPLRLTFVEFYKNAGFEGGGKPYKPFRKQTA